MWRLASHIWGRKVPLVLVLNRFWSSREYSTVVYPHLLMLLHERGRGGETHSELGTQFALQPEGGEEHSSVKSPSCAIVSTIVVQRVI